MSIEIAKTHHGVIYLGLCERVSTDNQILKSNILGFGNHIFSYIFPSSISSYKIAIAIYELEKSTSYNFEIIDSNDEQLGFLNLSIESNVSETEIYENNIHRVGMNNKWQLIFIPLDDFNAVINEPGIYKIFLNAENQKIKLGEFQSVYLEVPKPSADIVSAIKSDPTATKAARVEVGCKFCNSKYKAYSAFEHIEKLEIEGWIWYEQVMDFFHCECRKTKIDLQYIRKNLHALLGQSVDSNQNALPFYEKNALQKLKRDFIDLLNLSPREENLQKFIEENTILLHQFPAKRIIFKPPIFSSYKADFAIVTSQKELLLIEIETTKTQLMKKNGHQHSDLSHAYEQVKDWLRVIDEHRLSVLADLGISQDEVSVIKGIVIAGREQGYDSKKFRELKMIEHGRVGFLTYDDLVYALDSLIKRFSSIK